jgi:hypothetical protein
MSLTPDLDALWLELAAACFDSITKQFAYFAKSGRAEGITDDGRARFRIAADVIGWGASAPRFSRGHARGLPKLVTL